VTATGRVVVVTGASSGIGRATAIQLSRSGSVVVLASRSESALLAAQQDCAPGMTTVVPTDVSRRHEVEALMDEAIRVHGRVDAVVHAAAVLVGDALQVVDGFRGVGIEDEAPQVGHVVHEARQDLERELRIRQLSQRFDFQLRNFIGHVQAAVGRETLEQDLGEAARRRPAARGDVLHAISSASLPSA